MEVRQLQIFCVLANELNFTRTAERMHTVQSNVTTQIKALEEELGIPLFDRLAKRVVLTEAGRRFLPYAEKALTAMAEGRFAVQNSSEPAGALRIGAPESVLAYCLPEALQAFRKRYPKVELIFFPLRDETLIDALEAGWLDMAIRMIGIMDHPQCASIRLRRENICLLARPEHPLAQKRAVSVDDLAGQELLLTESGCAYREKFEQALSAHKVRLGNITEFSSMEAVKQCAAAGMGIGLLPGIAAAAEMRAGQLKELRWSGPALDIATHIVWHKDKWPSPGMLAFIDVLREKLQGTDAA